jgi:hypothetical protein
VLCGPQDAGVGDAAREGDLPLSRSAHPDPRGPELGRGGRAGHRVRPPYGLHRSRADHSSGGAHGAACDARDSATDWRDDEARRGLRRGEIARAYPGEGPPSRTRSTSSS